MFGYLVCRNALVSIVLAVRGADAQRLQAVALGVGHAAERHAAGRRRAAPLRLPSCAHVQPAPARRGRGAQRLAPGAHVDALGDEPLLHQRRDLRVLPGQQPRRRLDQRDLAAQAREGLRQLAADRAAAEHHQPSRQFPQVPDGVRRHVAGLVEPRQRRHGGPRARGDDDVPGRQRLRRRSRPGTSTVHGDVSLAVPRRTSTPSAA